MFLKSSHLYDLIYAFKDYAGDPFESLIYPRVSEALKEVTAEQSAETIVKKREEIKTRVLASAKGKIGDILFIEDIVIQDVALSNELESAIAAGGEVSLPRRTLSHVAAEQPRSGRPAVEAGQGRRGRTLEDLSAPGRRR